MTKHFNAECSSPKMDEVGRTLKKVTKRFSQNETEVACHGACSSIDNNNMCEESL